jgi:hypothetical protein
MQFLNDRTGELVGDLADISLSGFRLEGTTRIPVNTEVQFRVDLPPEVSYKPCIVFTARSRWSQPHPIDGRLYEAGFEIMRMDAGDNRAFALIFDRYGSSTGGKSSGTDYLWRS